MIGIIDYGMGNLHSVQNGFRHVGLDSIISSDPKELEACSHLVLPGVGAFGDMMSHLQEKKLDQWILDQVNNQDKKLLGICLGMQALFDISYEKGEYQGLGLLQGQVEKMDNEKDASLRIPQIGWNELILKDHPLKEVLSENPFYYFDHSYYANHTNPEEVIAWCEYGPYQVPAIVGKGNVLGVQGHPEKSGKDGLKLLAWFGKDFS